jgi:hypothetical protein
MDYQIKQLWIDALRSGEYKQGRGRLKRDDAYCCLGVLCDLHRKETGAKWWRSRDPGVDEYLCSSAALPMQVTCWAGLKQDDPRTKGVQTLAQLNDSGMDFQTIADIIEKEL